MKNDKIYWYIDKKSRDAQNHLDIDEIVDCYIKDEPKTFFLDFRTKKDKIKTYILTSNTP